MKIALIGATGFVGSHLLAEALRRGHTMTAIARRTNGIPQSSRVRPLKGDLADEVGLTRELRGHDVVINATKFIGADAARLFRIVRGADFPRLLVVGGAGSLEVKPGLALVDTPDFPPEYKAEALAGRNFLNALRNEQVYNWTFLSPSAFLTPDEPTGKFRLGSDQLLVDEAGESRISVGDFAIALIDEVEQARHPRQRFTVGY